MSQVPAASHTLDILTLLASSRGPLPASVIATRLEIPRSTVYHLLKVLQEHGYVLHLPDEKRYGLGLAAVELNTGYERHSPLMRVAKPLIADLVVQTRANAHLAVWRGRDVLYAIEERVPGSYSLITEVGVRLPMAHTASGRAILAALPKAQVRALFPDASAFVPGQGDSADLDRYSKLRSILDETLTRGYALETESVSTGMASVAVAALDHRTWPVAAVAVTVPVSEATIDRQQELASQAASCARELSRRIHGSTRDHIQ